MPLRALIRRTNEAAAEWRQGSKVVTGNFKQYNFAFNFELLSSKIKFLQDNFAILSWSHRIILNFSFTTLDWMDI